VADYGAEAGSERGCADNRIYSNRFHIVGRDYPEYPDYVPMAWAFFHSASGGDTYIYDNDIVVEHRDPESKAEAAAFYIGGANNGGFWYNNRITSNVPAIWLATPYGSAHGARFSKNSITITDNQTKNINPVRIGFSERPGSVATGIEFRSNEIHGSEFGADIVNTGHSYTVYWTLTVHVRDANNNGIPEQEVRISDCNGRLKSILKTGANGSIAVELPEYRVNDKSVEKYSPYTTEFDDSEREVILNRNRGIIIDYGP
jgi:hypothetical protein